MTRDPNPRKVTSCSSCRMDWRVCLHRTKRTNKVVPTCLHIHARALERVSLSDFPSFAARPDVLDDHNTLARTPSRAGISILTLLSHFSGSFPSHDPSGQSAAAKTRGAAAWLQASGAGGTAGSEPCGAHAAGGETAPSSPPGCISSSSDAVTSGIRCASVEAGNGKLTGSCDHIVKTFIIRLHQASSTSIVDRTAYRSDHGPSMFPQQVLHARQCHGPDHRHMINVERSLFIQRRYPLSTT